MEKEDKLLRRHFLDLSRRASQKGIPMFSDFLDMGSCDVLLQTGDTARSEGSSLPIFLYGGYAGADRRVAAFLPDEGYSLEERAFPISAIRIVPANRKYAQELSHRDILGALMHLGTKREMVGDILCRQGEDPLFFCVSRMAAFFTEELRQVARTAVLPEVVPLEGIAYTPVFREETALCASNRLDAFVASVCHISRQKASDLIAGEKVFLNQRAVTSQKKELSAGDVLSIRGAGKLCFDGWAGESKKGRKRASYRWYV